MDFLVNIDIDDLDKALQFYSAAFGLNAGRRLGTYGVEMRGGSAPLYLLTKASGTRAADTTLQRRDYVRHWTHVHLDFVVDEIEPAVQQAVSSGALSEQPISIQK